MAEDDRPNELDPTRWVRRGVFVGVLVIGWVFILWQNKFYITAPTVFVCLGYLAVVSAIVTLWRTGAAVVDDADELEADSTWGAPLGRRGELDREKRVLLKAIKEAEFDREMGKLSAPDAEQMITVYRARAIEVIKEIDKLEGATAGTVREQIAREVQARLEIHAEAAQAAAQAKTQAKAQAKKGKGKAPKTPTGAATSEAKPAEAKAEDAEDAEDAKPEDTNARDASAEDASADDASADDAKAEATADGAKADGATADGADDDAEDASEPAAAVAERAAEPASGKAKEATR